jgi:hypothetical protein
MVCILAWCFSTDASNRAACCQASALPATSNTDNCKKKKMLTDWERQWWNFLVFRVVVVFNMWSIPFLSGKESSNSTGKHCRWLLKPPYVGVCRAHGLSCAALSFCRRFAWCHCMRWGLYLYWSNCKFVYYTIFIRLCSSLYHLGCISLISILTSKYDSLYFCNPSMLTLKYGSLYFGNPVHMLTSAACLYFL